MPDIRKADAVKIPQHMAGPGDARDHQAMLASIARPLMGLPDGAAVNCAGSPMGGLHFIRPALGSAAETHAQTELFATDHPRRGEERYVWVDRSDGVLLGFLKPDAAPAKPAPPDPSKLAENMAEAAKAHPWLAEAAHEGG